MHVGHAEEDKEIKRIDRREETQDFPGTKKARVKDQNDREEGGD